MHETIFSTEVDQWLQGTYAVNLAQDYFHTPSDARHEALLERLSSLRNQEKERISIKITCLENEVTYLKEQLQLSHQRHFGKQSEVMSEAQTPEVSMMETVATYSRRKKKSCGRLIDTTDLPEKVIEYDLTSSEKHCSQCKTALTFFEKETSEQIEIMPAKYYKVVHVRFKYRCRCCDRFVMASKTPAPIPKALAGASLLTEIILGKYVFHLPLYRQSQLMRLENIIIPDNTLCNWVMTIGDLLKKLYEHLFQAVTESTYLQVDETPVKLLKPNKQGYVWTYRAPQLSLVAFECANSRSKTIVENRLSHFTGLLQTDGYAGYQGLRAKKTIRPLGCLAHVRRKFVEIVKITKNPHGIAGQVIEKLKPLYALEQICREHRCDARTRKRYRQKKAYPILKALKRFLKQHLPETAPNSALGNALRYFLKQWPYLTAYLKHGIAEIDNNQVENTIRPIALGRKNWLFMHNQDTGVIHAIFYSLLTSAVLNQINPRIYLHYLLTQVHALRKKTVDPESLLPHRIDKKLLEKFATQWFHQARAIFDSS